MTVEGGYNLAVSQSIDLTILEETKIANYSLF